MTDRAELLSKLEAATGPDMDLDAALAEFAGAQIKREPKPRNWRVAEKRAGPWRNLPRYTSSIDAALALVERLLPGFDYILEHTNGGLTISCLLGTADPDKRAFGATPSLAILIALLRSLPQDTK